MKILFVTTGNPTNYYQGNFSPQVKGPAEALRKSGIDLDFFQINNIGVLGYLKSIPLLREQLKINNYDIIHAHYGNCGIVSAISKIHEKLVVSYMGSDLLGSINHKGKYTLSGWIFVLFNKIFSFYFNDHSIVKSKMMKNKLWDKKNVTVIPNGVNFETFYPLDKKKARLKLNIKNNKPMVLFVSDPAIARKNFTLAKKAVDKFNNNINFKIVSGVEHSKLNLYYNAADALLLTSIHEGSPNVIKEAMTCNCPIVSTDVGDVKEIISSTTGCYITSFEIDDIVEKLEKALLLRTRTKGRENIKHLKDDIISKQMIYIYNKLLNKN